ncbi:SGNH/GDSL hydrolase family protein [Aquisphaera insulae]|uniref:SGNH/GDSL hydrolase family protein n=1 Tax=Aquisphaera insulae TaxID=2712864 RepID=UPI0013EC26AA|nr:GDSL-type esterase/lipase family protein [Aquisphaera insulae]
MRRLPRWLARGLAGFRTAWLILGITLLLIAALELALRAGFWIKDRGRPQVPPDPRVLAAVAGSETWLPLHYRELDQLSDRWQPYVYFRQRPFAGRTIHIDPEGLRATWNAPAATNPTRPIRILLLGGSSLWGFGSRDDQTIPSWIARKLHDRGIQVEIRNLAEIGYVSTQEVVALLRELQAGYRPDVVIFYDGVNDTTSAMLEGEPTVTTNEVNRSREFNLLQSPRRLTGALIANLATGSALYRLASSIRTRLGIAGSGRTGLPEEKLRDLAAGVVRGYESNVAMVQALGKTQGFRALMVWQPDVFSRVRPIPFEAEEAEKFGWVRPLFQEVHRGLRASSTLKADAAFLDLSEVLAERESLSFVDYCHVTEEANEVVATAIVARLLELHLLERPAL